MLQKANEKFSKSLVPNQDSVAYWQRSIFSDILMKTDSVYEYHELNTFTRMKFRRKKNQLLSNTKINKYFCKIKISTGKCPNEMGNYPFVSPFGYVGAADHLPTLQQCQTRKLNSNIQLFNYSIMQLLLPTILRSATCTHTTADPLRSRIMGTKGIQQLNIRI